MFKDLLIKFDPNLKNYFFFIIHIIYLYYFIAKYIILFQSCVNINKNVI